MSISGPGFARVALGDVAGGSPPVYTIQLASVDADNDGLVDWWENNYVGNLTDLNGDGIADFDEDGLSDLDEFEEYGSDPTEADTDNDGLSDSADVAAGASPTEAAPMVTGLMTGLRSMTTVLTRLSLTPMVTGWEMAPRSRLIPIPMMPPPSRTAWLSSIR